MVSPNSFFQIYFLFFFLLVGVLLTACRDNDTNISESPQKVTEPEITSFTASSTTVISGSSITLTPEFNNGTGSIDNGIGIVDSGTPISINPTESHTYTLTVVSADGVSKTLTVEIIVEAVPPEITSFTASSTTVTSGSSITLTAIFSNGSGTIDAGVGAVNSGVSLLVYPKTSGVYTLTVENADGVKESRSVDIIVEPESPISLTIVSPIHNDSVSNEKEIFAKIQTEYDIVSVTAFVEDRSVVMEYFSSNRYFHGILSLTGLAAGTHVLTITAEDLQGNTVSQQQSIVLDSKPVLSITEPIELSVASPTLPLDISCSDDVGDCEITVSGEGKRLASGVNTLINTLGLSAYEGREITLSFQGKDSANQMAETLTRTVYVESSANLNKVADFPGEIIDFNGEQVLIRTLGDSGDSLAIHEILSEEISEVEVPVELTVSSISSFLTLNGAIYQAWKFKAGYETKRETSKIYDWNDSVLYDLGPANRIDSLTVVDDYAIWNHAANLFLRQISTMTNTSIDRHVGSARISIVNNDVIISYVYIFGKNYTIKKYSAGISATLIGDANSNYGVVSDGNLYVYAKDAFRACFCQEYAIAYHDGINEILLRDFKATSSLSVPGRDPYYTAAESRPKPGRDYQINNGWIAFTDFGNLKQIHIWAYDPTGTLLQRTIFGSDSWIDGLSSDGEVMLTNSGKRYLSDATGQLTEVGSTLGSSTNIDGVWYITIGRSLFEVK